MQVPDYRHLDLAELPEDEWPTSMLTSGVWTIFPHISIASFGLDEARYREGGKIFQVSQLFPGDNPDTSITHQNFLATFSPDEQQVEQIERQKDFLRYVVGEEDYFTGNRIQKTIKTGAKTHFVFGRNEGGPQIFHKWTNALVAADNQRDLLELYKNGIS